MNNKLRSAFLANKPKNLALTGRVEDWLKSSQSRLPASCTTFSVQDSMENEDGIEASWIFTSHGLRTAAGVALDLSLLRPKGSDNGKGLVSSGAVSFATIYSQLNEVLRRGGVFRNGAITLFLDHDHQDCEDFLNADPSLLPWAKKAIYIDATIVNNPLLPLIAEKVNQGTVWLAKKQWDASGSRLYSNVCVSADTWITTDKGNIQVKDLVNKDFVAVVDGQHYKSQPLSIALEEPSRKLKHYLKYYLGNLPSIKGFYPTSYSKVFEVSTKTGHKLKATADHKILTTKGLKTVKSLTKKDSLILNGDTLENGKSTRVVAVKDKGFEVVYDCTIEDIHLFAANGILVSNCLEVLLKSRGTCLLSHINLGSCTPDSLLKDFQDSMFWLCTLHAHTGIGKEGEYLSYDKDKQVGLGVIGLANFLAINRVTYRQFVQDLTEVNLGQGKPDTLAFKLNEAYQAAAKVARKFKMERAFTVAPTANMHRYYRDSDGFTTAAEISPPLDYAVDRDSQLHGVETYEFHPRTEVAKEVGWDTQWLLLEQYQTMMDNTGLAHAISANLWSTAKITPEWITDVFLDSPLKTTYYRLSVNQDALNKSEIIVKEEPTLTCPVVKLPTDDPNYCEACGG
jgi:hypothetical protein